MKSTIMKNVTSLLILASAVQPFTSQAADTSSATVNITATVDATVTLDVANTFDLKNNKDVQTLDIKTTSNGVKVKLEVSQVGASDNYIVLSSTGEDKQSMNVKATLGDSREKFKSGTLSIEVPSSATQQTTKLNLTAQPTATQAAGTYSGVITVKASTM